MALSSIQLGANYPHLQVASASTQGLYLPSQASTTNIAARWPLSDDLSGDLQQPGNNLPRYFLFLNKFARHFSSSKYSLSKKKFQSKPKYVKALHTKLVYIKSFTRGCFYAKTVLGFYILVWGWSYAKMIVGPFLFLQDLSICLSSVIIRLHTITATLIHTFTLYSIPIM